VDLAGRAARTPLGPLLLLSEPDAPEVGDDADPASSAIARSVQP
jgi:hypothetical protein